MQRVAGATSPQGNPLPEAADRGGGATNAVARRAGEEGGRENYSDSLIEANNDYNHRYKRHQINDVKDWKQNRKRKRADPKDEDTALTYAQIRDPVVARLEADKEKRHYDRWHVPPLGNLTRLRPQGVFRLMACNINGASSTTRRDKKVKDISRIIDDWDIQGGCLQEVGINWASTNYSRNMTSWFRLDHREAKTIAAHNIHENVELAQQGGVAQFACKEQANTLKNLNRISED